MLHLLLHVELFNSFQAFYGGTQDLNVGYNSYFQIISKSFKMTLFSITFKTTTINKFEICNYTVKNYIIVKRTNKYTMKVL